MALNVFLTGFWEGLLGWSLLFCLLF